MRLSTWNDSEEEYNAVLEEALEKAWIGIVVARRDGKFVYCNDVYNSISGYSGEMLENSCIQEVANNSQEGKSSSIEVLKNKKEIYMEQRSMLTNKQYMIKAFPLFDENNEVKYMVSNLLDITRLEKLNEELNRERLAQKRQRGEISRLLRLLGDDTEANIIYKSKLMDRLMEMVRLVAKSDATVLISGESGTGKELFARELHRNSPRADKPFLVINCSAIPENLLESELFGYAPGTFTGGSGKGKKGILETANGGTILLDEIGDMPFSLQAKLLRVLQNKEVTPLGGHTPIKIDVRFIAATNLDLIQQVKKKAFRQDLYYRISIIPVKIPPLRERKGDIPLLIHYFMEYFNIKYGKNKVIEERAVQILVEQNFPGNVRQLKNLLERACLITTEDVLDAVTLSRLYKEQEVIEIRETDADNQEKISMGTLHEMMEAYEKNLLEGYKKKYRSTYKIAEILGTNQSTISRKLQKYHII